MPDTLNTALLIVRVWLGIVFLAHGIKHAVRRAKTGNWLKSVGYRRPDLQWFAMTATEIGVGVLLVLGLLTALAAAGVIATMVVAFWVVHRFAGFWVTARPDEGWEFVATIAALSVTLALTGPGEWSLDDALGIATDLDGWVGAAVAGGGGVAAAAAQLALFWRRPAAEN